MFLQYLILGMDLICKLCFSTNVCLCLCVIDYSCFLNHLSGIVNDCILQL